VKSIQWQIKKQKRYMTEDLIKRIVEWNSIKYPKDNETRIIIATLKPEGAVTTAINNI
jgi:hypothetical protein